MDDRGYVLDDGARAQDIYSTLKSNEIRTLVISPGKKGTVIRCELEVITQATTVQYEALSYVWGEPSDKDTIICNGFEFAVTTSLFTALSYLRYPTSWRRLWVDQICINQSKAEELAAQVGLMGKIYSSATRVIVWLGKDDANLARAWKLLQETAVSDSLVRSDFAPPSPSRSPVSSKRPSPGRRVNSQSSFSTSFSSSRESLLSFSSSSSRSSISKHSSPHTKHSPMFKHALAIFQHVWFGRKWTFQEIVLAKAAVICCGNVEMGWSDLTSWYFHYASKLRSSSMLYDSHGEFENIINIRNEHDKGDLKLSTLLMLTRQRQSLKPEDAIYALLGLIPDLALHLHPLRSTFSLAGSTSPFEIYLAAFIYCLRTENDLTILSAAGLYKGNPEHQFPSWLPDWRNQYPIRPAVLSESKSYDELDMPQQQASGFSKPLYSFRRLRQQSQHLLTVRGFRIGCLCTRPGTWPNTWLVADTIAQSLLDQTTFVSSSPSSRKYHQSFTGLSSIFTNIPKKSSVATYAETVINKARHHPNQNCQTVRTHAAVETGDWLCVLFGGACLYVLRPTDERADNDRIDSWKAATSVGPRPRSFTCRFIGECVVDGLMNGKLMKVVTKKRYLDFELT